ncbi:putative ribonuclease H-like domain-containing protein [Tanacetum coccineum]
MRGFVVRNKAILVAQGYTQEEGIDYDAVFAPVDRIKAIRAWYETLSTYLLENRFRRGTIDKTLFIKKDKGDILLVQVYVDDIIFGSTKKSLCVEFEQMMHKRFQMSSMGELTFFLGLQVKQKDDGIFISQDKYVADILKKFDFVTVKTTSTPIKTNKALLKDEEAEDVDVHLYRSMIGSLMYLTASRPDIMFVVCACARFQVTPKVSHHHAGEEDLRYLKGQPKLGLWYPRDSPFDLEAFSDSDYAGASLDRKSTTGGCQFLGKRLISWQCKKQTIVANSTTEAEYVAAANCCGQVLWIQNQMLDYGFNFMNTKIYIDNESTICIVKNPVFHSKTKHIEIRHHFIRDYYEKRLIQVIKIHIDHNVADVLTKAFDVSRTEGNADFHQIVDFLNASTIRELVQRGSPKFKKPWGKVEGLESDLMKTKKLYATAFKELINRVKSLEDEDDFVVEDPSKQGRSLIEEMDLDAGISLVPPHVETLMEIRKSAAKDKSKAKMDETESLRKMKQRERVHISRDEEVAQKLQEEFDATERKRMAQVHQAAQGTCQSKKKKFFAQQRAEAKRNKPMTPAQQKDYMSNYIKNQEGGYSIKQLKSLLYEQRLKSAGQEVLEEPVKRQKIGEASGSVRYPIIAVEKFDRDDLDKLWDLVKERFSTTEPTDDKEKELWVELKRLFEPNNNDILWKLQRYMHDPLVWRIYDTCGVHHVSLVRGHDIFMLVEKEYPLTRGTLGLMMVARQLVEADSEMPRELLRQIFYQANTPRFVDVLKGKRIENGAKTGIIGLNLVKSNYYSSQDEVVKSPRAYQWKEREKTSPKPPIFYDDDDVDDEESSIPLRDIISKLPLSVTITLVLPTIEDPKDSLIMGNVELSTIPKKESDEFIKSSVEDLVPIPCESEDTSGSDSECILPSCDDITPINVYEEKSVTFSNPLFDSNDDFTSSDKESLSDEDVLEDNFKIYSNPLFEFDDEYISSDVNPIFDEVLDNIESKDSYVSNLDEPALLVTPLSNFNEDECFDLGGDVDDIELLLHHDPSISVVSILEGFTDEPPLEENDDLFDLESKENEWKKILYDAPISDLKIMVKILTPRFLRKNFLLHMCAHPLRIAIIFHSHLLSGFFFLISLIRWFLLFFSPLGVRISFLTPASLLFIFLSRWHINVQWKFALPRVSSLISRLYRESQARDSHKNKRFVGGNPCLSLVLV